MKHSIMRVAVAATLSLSALAANAGTIGVAVGSTLAAESVTASVVVTQPTITYQTASLINDGATVYVHVRFSAGDMNAAGAVVPAAADIHVFVSSVDTPGNYSIGLPVADTDGLGYRFALTAVATKGGLPSGAVINILNTTAKLTALNTALASGGTVTTTVGYTVTPGDFSAVATFVEPVSTATLLTSKKALSQVTKNSNAILATYFTAAETGRVDVAQSLNKFTGLSPTAGTTLINLGAAKVVIDTTLKNATTGVAIVAADLGTTVYKATGDFSVAGATAYLATAETCAVSAYAGTIATGGMSVTFAAASAGDALAPLYVCYSVPGTKAIAYNVQYAIGGGVMGAGATTVTSTGAGANTYFLTSNGASVVVPSFVPTTGAVGTGYNTYLRVINTGNLTTDISGAAYNSATGATGTVAKLATALPAGGSVMLTTDAVTTALGLPAGWSALLITGSTSKLAVQPLLVNPQGIITNLGAVNGGNNAATSN
jgi:hypothetical protein